jgi:predicted nucleic acid-binding protein
VFVLDTDTVSNFLVRNRNYQALQARVNAQPAGTVYLSIITLEEVLRGQVNAINTARSRQNGRLLLEVYALFHQLYEALREFPVLPYNEGADRLYQGLDPKVRNAHKQDARISAIVANYGFTLVTRNTQHHEKIGLAKLEDWTNG